MTKRERIKEIVSGTELDDWEEDNRGPPLYCANEGCYAQNDGDGVQLYNNGEIVLCGLCLAHIIEEESP